MQEYFDTLVSDNKKVIISTRKSKYSRMPIHQGRNKEEFMKVTTPQAEEHGDPAAQVRVNRKMFGYT